MTQGRVHRPRGANERWRRAALAAVAAVSAGALLVATTAVALDVAPVKALPGYPAAARFDTGRPAAPYVPLSDAYVDRVLRPALADTSPGGPDAGPRVVANASTHAAARQEPVDHPFTNDNLANAHTISSVPFSGHTDTRTATRQAEDPTSCSAVGGTAWYRYTPSKDTNLRANTFGTNYADALAVFEATSPHDLTPVGCNSSPTGNAQLGFRARAGGTYLFQISGVASGGALVFNLAPAGQTVPVPGEGFGFGPVISADGRYVAFLARAEDAPPSDVDAACPYSPLGTIQYCAFGYVKDLVTGTIQMITVSSSGQPANSPSFQLSISADGRYVSFQSTATNLVEGGDTNGISDIFVRDRVTATTTRESVASSGAQAEPRTGDGPLGAGFATLSADGRYLAFSSDAPNLAPDAPSPADECVVTPAVDSECLRVFLRDRVAQTTTLVSRDFHPQSSGVNRAVAADISADGAHVLFTAYVAPAAQAYVWDRATRTSTMVSETADGKRGNADGTANAISADGRFVAFITAATNLVPGDTNGTNDVFVHDRVTHHVERVSVASDGAQAQDASSQTEGGEPQSVQRAAQTGTGDRWADLSAGGRMVTFNSSAPNLVPGDTNGTSDVFVHDRRTGATIRVSVSSTGDQGGGNSDTPAISADGRAVAFYSDGTFDGVLSGVYVHRMTPGAT